MQHHANDRDTNQLYYYVFITTAFSKEIWLTIMMWMLMHIVHCIIILHTSLFCANNYSITFNKGCNGTIVCLFSFSQWIVHK